MPNQKKSKFSALERVVSLFVVMTFVFTSVIPPQMAQAQNQPMATILNLPSPGSIVSPTSGYNPAMITGMITHPDNPLEFDFIVDPGESRLTGEAFNEEARKMIKYFLASLTTPNEEMWVNLSPYEGNRIIPTALGVTEMGRDLLAQDYILKQLTASLMYPDEKLGGEFWNRVHQKSMALYGTSDIPMNTFSKIWIVPDKATVYQKGSSAFVLESHLKVMLEEDYVALKANLNTKEYGTDQVSQEDVEVISGYTSELVKEVLLPEIEYEINNGRHFAKLRQIANAMVLATWYKQNLRESLLGYVYVDQNKTRGVDVEDRDIKEKIYQQYLKAFERGVYSYVREDYDPTAGKIIPRKYFSGGFVGSDYTNLVQRNTINGDTDTVAPRIRQLVQQRIQPVADNAILSVNVNLIDVGPRVDQQALQQVTGYADTSAVDMRFGQGAISLRPKSIGSDFAMLGKTVIAPEVQSSLVRQGGEAIRQFLSELAPYVNNRANSPYADIATVDAVWQAAQEYQSNPSAFTDDQLVAKPNTVIPRIEVRGLDTTTGEVDQVGVIGIPGNYRQPALQEFNAVQGAESLSVRMGGFMTLEANVRGVDKSLPLDYLDRNFDRIISEINYTPGNLIDSQATRTVIATDGDGTLYGKPNEAGNPILADSQAYSALIDYLQAGGVYALISGNDLELTRQRLLEGPGIPTQLRNRFLVIANGGAKVAYLDAQDNLVEIESYRNEALSQNQRSAQTSNLDVVYIGDDQKQDGNDMPGFQKVGFNRAISVSPAPVVENPAGLRSNYVGNQESGTAAVIQAVVQIVQQAPKRPVFTSQGIPRIVQTARGTFTNTDYSQATRPDSAMLAKTVIAPEVQSSLVRQGGEAIRQFLSELAPYVNDRANSPYADIATVDAVWQAAQEYQSNPSAFTDEQLVAKPNTVIPRIEVRGLDTTTGEVDQVGVIGIPGNYRQPALQEFNAVQGAESLSVRMGGFMTLEANVRGVDKSLPLDYLDRNFDRIISEINYTPGNLIDSQATRTVIATDGDGTLYGKPNEAGNPILADSQAYSALIDYLQAGGVYALISGNDLELTRQRLLEGPGIPTQLRNRFLVIANGGAKVAYLDAQDNLVEIESYRNEALSQNQRSAQTSNLDVVYIGDDQKQDGNDMPGFQKVGFNRAISVSPAPVVENPAGLRSNYVGNQESGTAAVIQAVVQIVQQAPKRPVFTSQGIPRIVQTARGTFTNTDYSQATQPDSAMLGKTVIAPEVQSSLVRQGGEAIRQFLSELAPYVNNRANSPYADIATVDAVWQAAQEYQSNPSAFTDDQLVAKPNTVIPRIEVRGLDTTTGEVDQVGVIGIPGNYRQPALQEFNAVQGAESLSVRMGGFMTLEANVRGVDKSLPLDYLDRNFDRIISEINYTPGNLIDSQATRTVIATDGDGTLYGKPNEAGNPILADSQAYSALIDYLQAGGVYALISGNDLELTRQRLLEGPGIPTQLRNRFLVIANGGAKVAYLDAQDNLVEIESYRNEALSQNQRSAQTSNLDVVYIGDDQKQDGNDMPGFQKVGFNRAISVSPAPVVENPAGLRSNYVGNQESGTAAVIQAVVQIVQQAPKRPVFTSQGIPRIVQTARGTFTNTDYSQATRPDSAMLSRAQAQRIYQDLLGQGSNVLARIAVVDGQINQDRLAQELSLLAQVGREVGADYQDSDRAFTRLDRYTQQYIREVAERTASTRGEIIRLSQAVVQRESQFPFEQKNPSMPERQIIREQQQGRVIGNKLHTILSPQGRSVADFLKGGYNQPGYGVAAQAVNDGSHALGNEGNQGYYVDRTNIMGQNGTPKSGREVFVDTTTSMAEFFQRRAQRNGKPIRLVIKPGIGGQHTPFQGIADVFQVVVPETGEVVGEYELGKNYEESINNALQQLGATWDQVAVIPSSKSGSTDETMMIFVDVLKAGLKNVANMRGIDGEIFADATINYLNRINIVDGQEVAGEDLFKDFDFDTLVSEISARDSRVNAQVSMAVFRTVLGNMFFETTDRPEASRLSAFIRNSGLDQVLGEDAPGFGAMFDNVGGRWTGDLHMMAFLAFNNLNPNEYWQTRYEGIQSVRNGTHTGVVLADKIVNERIQKIALVVPDEYFWAAKGTEQNFNESIWQEGFANLRAIKASNWTAQQQYYTGPGALVVNASDLAIDQGYNVYNIDRVNQSAGAQTLANEFGRLFTTFYGMTYTTGNRLIARAVNQAGYGTEDIDVNDLNNPATQILQENLYLRQPYVELGKGLLEARLKELQTRQQAWSQAGATGTSPVRQSEVEMSTQAQQRQVTTNVPGISLNRVENAQQMADTITAARVYAAQTDRTFVPFLYVGGNEYVDLRESLVDMGVEWVMQGTGDQHISYQQVLANPDQYLPFFVSFVPAADQFQEGTPAIGFAKSYLDRISPNVVRDYFAQASFEALTDLRRDQGGLGVFMRTTESPERVAEVKEAFRQSFAQALDEGSDMAMLAITTEELVELVYEINEILQILTNSRTNFQDIITEAFIQSDSNALEMRANEGRLPDTYTVDAEVFVETLSDGIDMDVSRIIGAFLIPFNSPRVIQIGLAAAGLSRDNAGFEQQVLEAGVGRLALRTISDMGLRKEIARSSNPVVYSRAQSVDGDRPVLVMDGENLINFAAGLNELAMALAGTDVSRFDAVLESIAGQVGNSIELTSVYQTDMLQLLRNLARNLNEDVDRLQDALGLASNAAIYREFGDVDLGADTPPAAVISLAPVQPIEQPVDAAQTSDDFRKGGIDLNPELLDLQIKRDTDGVPLPIQQQPIENMNIDGFLPVIINVTPITNLPLLLGMADGEALPQELSLELSPADHKARLDVAHDVVS